MKPQGISEEQVKLRAFPFSLADSANEWLYYLPSGTITHDCITIEAKLGEMYMIHLDKELSPN